MLLTLVGLAFGSSPGHAQEPVGPAVTERLDVVEVVLDVLVTDRDGYPILGLGPDDFVVEEDGHPVPVASVAWYGTRRLLGSTDPPRTEPLDERTFVLLFYRPPIVLARSVGSLARLERAGAEAAGWMAEALLPGDRVAVLVWTGRLELVHDVTRDRERLEIAIHRATTGGEDDLQWPSRTEAPDPDATLRPALTGHRTDDLFAALETLGRALGPIPGRKALVLVGADFPEAGSAAARRGWDPMVQALNGENVAVYPIDLERSGRQPTPGRLARETGGSYLYDRGSLAAALDEVDHENSGYYLLSYRSRGADAPTGYRRVEVHTVNPELRARSRGGFLVEE